MAANCNLSQDTEFVLTLVAQALRSYTRCNGTVSHALLDHPTPCHFLYDNAMPIVLSLFYLFLSTFKAFSSTFNTFCHIAL